MSEKDTKELKTAVRFISRFLQMRIVVQAAYTKEVGGKVVTVPGSAIQFEQGVYETTDPEEVAFIEARQEFGRMIQRVPEGLEDIQATRAEEMKDLEEREADLAAREAALAAEKARLTPTEAGREEGEGEENADGLDAMSKAELLEVVEKEGVEGTNSRTKVEDLVVAIRTHREESPEFED